MRSQTDCNQPSQKDIIREMESKWREVERKKRKMNIATNSSSCFRIETQERRRDEETRHRLSLWSSQSSGYLFFFSYSLSLSFCTLMCSPWLCHIYKLVVEEVCVCVDWTHIIFEKKKKKQLIMKWGKKHKNKKMKQKMMMKHAVTESVFPLFEIDFQITWQKDSTSA